MIGLNDLLGRMSMRVASVAALGLLSLTIATGAANAETRVLKLYNLHTKEKVAIAFKKDGRYLPQGLKDLNWFLRDWRKKQPTQMDKRLLDLIWEAYRQSGSRDYINVICGFRSPGTNNMLRSRSAGVAKESQHTQGRAMDFFIPGVPLKKLREIGLRMEVGGVGYYPRSGSPFVHFDVGNVRHWPRMSRPELVAVFPKGNTIHVPTDGKPLPGYEQALAAYKARKGSSAVMMAASEPRGGGKTLFAALFGGGSDEEEDNADTGAAVAATAPKRDVAKPAPVPVLVPARQEPAPIAVAALAPTPKPKILAAGVPLPIRDTFDTSAPTPPAGIAERMGSPAEAAKTEIEVASLAPTRVPLPQWAPQRVAAKITAPATVVATGSAVSPRDEVSALMAAVDTTPAPAVTTAETAPMQQLAYAVPTPRSRPPFEALLAGQPGKPASPEAIREIANIVVPTPSAMPSRVAAAAPVPHVLATPSTDRSLVTASTSRQAKPTATSTPARSNLIVASNAIPAKKRVVGAVSALEAIPNGKTGRFVRKQAAPAAVASAVPAVPSQDAIQSRIEMAMTAAFAEE